MKVPTHRQLTIEVANQQTLLFDEVPLLEAVRMIAVDHGFRRGEISIAIVDDPIIKKFNKQYLEHDYETDTLSFVFDSDEESGLLSGQLVASAETAQRVAKKLGIPLAHEILLYVVHGALHLVGLNDQTPEAAIQMRRAEADYLSRFGVEHRWLEPLDDSDEPAKEHS